jgi:hypothetical protein
MSANDKAVTAAPKGVAGGVVAVMKDAATWVGPDAKAIGEAIRTVEAMAEALRYIVEAGESGDEVTAIEKAEAALAAFHGSGPATGGDLTDCRVPHSKHDACHNCEPLAATPAGGGDLPEVWDEVREARAAFEVALRECSPNVCGPDAPIWNALGSAMRAIDALIRRLASAPARVVQP